MHGESLTACTYLNHGAQVNREIETVGKAFVGCFSTPYTIAKTVFEKVSGKADTSVTDFFVLKVGVLGFLCCSRSPRR